MSTTKKTMTAAQIKKGFKKLFHAKTKHASITEEVKLGRPLHDALQADLTPLREKITEMHNSNAASNIFWALEGALFEMYMQLTHCEDVLFEKSFGYADNKNFTKYKLDEVKSWIKKLQNAKKAEDPFEYVNELIEKTRAECDSKEKRHSELWNSGSNDAAALHSLQAYTKVARTVIDVMTR